MEFVVAQLVPEKAFLWRVDRAIHVEVSRGGRKTPPSFNDLHVVRPRIRASLADPVFRYPLQLKDRNVGGNASKGGEC